MGSNLSPCKGCENREVGCHGQCEKYAEYKAERQRIFEKKKSEHETSRTGMEHYIKAHKHYHRAGVG